jgi:hypothetical protein
MAFSCKGLHEAVLNEQRKLPLHNWPSNLGSAEPAGPEPTPLAKPPTAPLTARNAAAMPRLSAAPGRGLSSRAARKLRPLNLAKAPSPVVRTLQEIQTLSVVGVTLRRANLGPWAQAVWWIVAEFMNHLQPLLF